MEMARGHLRQARRILTEAEHHHRDRVWHLAVRRCQEAVELALKAALRAAGVEVPHVHDVGTILREHAARLAEFLTRDLDRVVSISRRLRQEREMSFYGDEEVGAPAERLYTNQDAEEALEDARFVLDRCERSVAAPPFSEDQ